MGPQFRESSILSPPHLINLVGGVLMNQVGGRVCPRTRVSVYVIMKFRPVKPALN